MSEPDIRTLVLDFVESWEGGFEATARSIRETLTPDCVWKNSGLPDVQGHDASIALLRQARDTAGLEAIHTEVRTVVVQAPHVVVERLDHLHRADGTRFATLPALGIFTVRDGRISAWHDYLDPSPLIGAMAG